MAIEKILLGNTTKEAIDKANAAIAQVVDNADAIEGLQDAVANAGKVDSVTLNGQTIVNDSKVANIMIKGSSSIDIATVPRDESGNLGVTTISAPNLAKTIKLSMSDDNKYIMTAELLNADGSQVSKATLDLPLEEMVISGSYDDKNKQIVLTLKNGNTAEIPVADLVNGLVGAENNFSDAEILIADGDGKKAKSSGYKITDGGYTDGETTIPTKTFAQVMAKSSRPYPVPLAAFKAGSKLYDEQHEDYHKLILSATTTTHIIGTDSTVSRIVATMCDKLYRPHYISSQGNQILTDIEFAYSKETDGTYKTTIKIACDSSLQDKFTSWANDGYILWLFANQSTFLPSVIG